MSSDHDHDHDGCHEQIDAGVDDRDDWARRRRRGLPTGENPLVVACTDERSPVGDVLGLDLGDAQIYRNAGGKVTDDVALDPSLPALNIGDADLLDWVKMTDDITGTRRVPVSSQNAVAF